MHATTPTDDVWQPGETRDFTFVIFKSYGIGWTEYNIDRKYFKRTPEQFFVACKYKAISVNEEYENIMAYDFLPQWKDYQKEIGLR